MKILTLIFSIFTLLIGCRTEYEWAPDFDCNNIKLVKNISIPAFKDNNNLYIIFSDNYPFYNANVDFIPNSVIIYDFINDSLVILKDTKLDGIPLFLYKNKQAQIVVLTSKCLYTINDKFQLNKELVFNNNNDRTNYKKTLLEFNDDICFFKPGIDNPSNTIFLIDMNNFKYEVLENSQINLYQNKLTGYCFPMNNNIDFIFSDGENYFVKTSTDLIQKTLPNKEAIYSISYNNIDKEICIGSDYGKIYYDNGKELRSNIIADNLNYPNERLFNECIEFKITNINYLNNIFVYQNNYSSTTIEYYDKKHKNINRTMNFADEKSDNYNSIIPFYKGNLKYELFDSYLFTYPNSKDGTTYLYSNLNSEPNNYFKFLYIDFKDSSYLYQTNYGNKISKKFKF